jgi:hypothetical protein
VIGQLARADTSREVEEVCHVKAESQSRLLDAPAERYFSLQRNLLLTSRTRTWGYYLQEKAKARTKINFADEEEKKELDRPSTHR